ncbi:MAG: farnesyl-diphosphate farnesyltransferase [Verrucomicrobiales bacterium]
MENYEKALAGDLLAGVSRSFYTTLKVLPKSTRGTIGLMYLLARAADTIADTEVIETAVRVSFLEMFGDLVQDGGDYTQLQLNLRETFCPKQEHAKERELLTRVGECLEWLDAIGSARAEAIRKVLKTIVRGQRLDLERFAGDGVVALETAGELEEYTYLVAGSVGEFWTEVGFMELGEQYATKPIGEMLELGKRYGQALQLINILRDLPADRKGGRCYLPLEEIGAADAEPAVLMAVSEKWLKRCREHFDCGAAYVGSVKNRRMRLAAALPLLIGAKTLQLMEAADWEGLSAGIKVTRKEVKSVMLRALIANLTCRGMARHCRRELADGSIL